jgi:ASC-1-like (ASCH) protein
MAVHKLKIGSENFEAINRGNKTFELTLNDRDYQDGDILLLQEWNEDVGFMGREITVVVTYLLKGGVFGLKNGYVIMSFQRIDSDG